MNKEYVKYTQMTTATTMIMKFGDRACTELRAAEKDPEANVAATWQAAIVNRVFVITTYYRDLKAQLEKVAALNNAIRIHAKSMAKYLDAGLYIRLMKVTSEINLGVGEARIALRIGPNDSIAAWRRHDCEKGQENLDVVNKVLAGTSRRSFKPAFRQLGEPSWWYLHP